MTTTTTTLEIRTTQMCNVVLADPGKFKWWC